MLIHSYDSITGQYLRSGLADPDPRNPGRWLEPAFTTTQALPDRGRNEWPFFDKSTGAWKLLPDYTGILLYRTTDGEAAEVTVKGISLEEAGLTTEPRPDSVHTWRDGQWKPDPVLVARQLRETAMAEFSQRVVVAQVKTLGKTDAYQLGLLTPQEVAEYRAWSKYQMALTRVVNGGNFPEDHVWPQEPDEAAIAAELQVALDEMAAKEEREAKAKAGAEQHAADQAKAAKQAAEAAEAAAGTGE
ncbi:tail fiber assembly protein [Cupriavidus pauculus]|uniref:tail fiber assembly protein n=1 Tax=Cupriavidus pauculus TaxID=82633 RepID=UPI001D0C2FA6|nr:tail fiber assembly protein [Cupriavidus pauculus]